MPVQRLVTEQQFAQIGIRSSHARMQVSSPKGQMSMQNVRPQLEVNTELPRFRVPRERIRSESGLAGPLSFAKEFRNKGRSAALRAVGAYASDGDFVANHRIPGDRSFPLLAKNKMNSLMRKPETNIGLMPSSPPSLDWSKGVIDINFSRHNIGVDWSGSNLIDVTVDEGFPAEVSLLQRHDFRILGMEPAVENRTMGNFIDRSV